MRYFKQVHIFTAKTRRREEIRDPFASPRLCGENGATH